MSILATYETDSDYTLRIYDSPYSCYGLEIISPERDRLFFAECLSIETAGWNAILEEPWTVSEWRAWLRGEASYLINKYCTFCEECQEYKPRCYLYFGVCQDCSSILST